jgi:hypothetical protein
MGGITWSIASSVDKNYIFELAKTKGWLDDPPKVQVKRYKGLEEWYIIEPYEENCNCPNLVYPPKEFNNG